MIRRLFDRLMPALPPVLLQRAGEAIERGELALAEDQLALGWKRYEDATCASILVTLLGRRGALDEAQALLSETQGRGLKGLALQRSAVELAARQGDPEAVLLARRAAASLEGDDEGRRAALAELLRLVYWIAPTAPAPFSELHCCAAEVLREEWAGFLDLTGDAPLWNQLPEDQRNKAPANALQNFEAAARRFRALPRPIIEIDGETQILSDAEAITGSALELFGDDGGLVFVPFSELWHLRFEPGRLTARVDLMRRNGQRELLWMPLFYRWSNYYPELLQLQTCQPVPIGPSSEILIGLRCYQEINGDGFASGMTVPADQLMASEWKVRD